MKMTKGWIKLHRGLLEHGIFQEESLLRVWMYCLLQASYREMRIPVGRQTVHLQPGQLLYGRKAVSQRLNMSEGKLRHVMQQLEEMGAVSVASTNRYSVVTIVNWKQYQQETGKTEFPFDCDFLDEEPTETEPDSFDDALSITGKDYNLQLAEESLQITSANGFQERKVVESQALQPTVGHKQEENKNTIKQNKIRKIKYINHAVKKEQKNIESKKETLEQSHFVARYMQEDSARAVNAKSVMAAVKGGEKEVMARNEICCVSAQQSEHLKQQRADSEAIVQKSELMPGPEKQHTLSAKEPQISAVMAPSCAGTVRQAVQMKVVDTQPRFTTHPLAVVYVEENIPSAEFLEGADAALYPALVDDYNIEDYLPEIFNPSAENCFGHEFLTEMYGSGHKFEEEELQSLEELLLEQVYNRYDFAVDPRTADDLLAANGCSPLLQQAVCAQEQVSEFSATQHKLQQPSQQTEQNQTESVTDITFQQASEIFERLWQRYPVKMGYHKVSKRQIMQIAAEGERTM